MNDEILIPSREEANEKLNAVERLLNTPPENPPACLEVEDSLYGWLLVEIQNLDHLNIMIEPDADMVGNPQALITNIKNGSEVIISGK